MIKKRRGGVQFIGELLSLYLWHRTNIATIVTDCGNKSLTKKCHNCQQLWSPKLIFSHLETNFNYVSTPFFLPYHSHATYVSVRLYEDLLHTNFSVLIGVVITSARFFVCVSLAYLHFHLPPLLEQNGIEPLCALFWNEKLDSLQYAKHFDYHKKE